jgi:hypothetical protein
MNTKIHLQCNFYFITNPKLTIVRFYPSYRQRSCKKAEKKFDLDDL